MEFYVTHFHHERPSVGQETFSAVLKAVDQSGVALEFTFWNPSLELIRPIRMAWMAGTRVSLKLQGDGQFEEQG